MSELSRALTSVASLAQLVEHPLGKREVMGSLPMGDSVSQCIVKIMVVFVIWDYDFFSRCEGIF